MAWSTANEHRRRPPVLPERHRKVGVTTVEWVESEPGVAIIRCTGGSIDDRWLAEVVTREELAACGIRQAKFSFDQSLPKVVPVEGESHEGYESGKPWVYHYPTDTLYTGPENWLHWDLIDNHPQLRGDFGEDHGFATHPDYTNGRIYGTENKFYHEHFPGHGWDHVDKDRINAALGTTTMIPQRWEDEDLWGDTPAQKSHGFTSLEKQFRRWESDSDLIPVQKLNQKIASWDDIMAKAKRLIQSGNVQLLRNGYNTVVAHVIGDHGEYTSEISRDDPNSRAITQWTCECPWDQYAFQRTRQWKKYEGRPCAHVLAAFWKSQATPLDEDAPPGATPSGPAVPPGPTEPGVPLSPFQPRLPVQGQPGPDGGMMPGLPPASQGQFGPPNLPPPSPLPPVGNPPMQQQMPTPFADPAGSGIIPPFPMDPAQLQLPVSVPGGRPGPYPANPIQQPGTFSHVRLANLPRVQQLPDPWEGYEGQHDTIWPLGNGYPSKPFIWDHNDNTVYLGSPGGYHSHMKLPNTVPYTQAGRLSQDGYVDWYGHDDEPQPFHPIVEKALNAKPIRRQPIDIDWDDDTEMPVEQHEWQQYTSAANDQFQPNQAARLNEATLGQSEGREGATDAGQWMEIPRNARVEVVYQDPTTGWVEIMYPLKGGPMTSYHVRCFVEPEKLTSMEGDSPMAPQRRSATQVQVHTPESLGLDVDDRWRGGDVYSAPMIYDHSTDTLHVGSEDEVRHRHLFPLLNRATSYPGYVSFSEDGPRGPGYRWYTRPPNADELHSTILGHMGNPNAVDLDTGDPPHLDW